MEKNARVPFSIKLRYYEKKMPHSIAKVFFIVLFLFFVCRVIDLIEFIVAKKRMQMEKIANKLLECVERRAICIRIQWD